MHLDNDLLRPEERAMRRPLTPLEDGVAVNTLLSRLTESRQANADAEALLRAAYEEIVRRGHAHRCDLVQWVGMSKRCTCLYETAVKWLKENPKADGTAAHRRDQEG